MTWEVFYFVCFLVGFLFSLLTFVGGASHLHIPKGLHFHGFHGHGVPHGHGATMTTGRPRGSTSAPSRRFWRGSAGPDIC